MAQYQRRYRRRLRARALAGLLRQRQLGAVRRRLRRGEHDARAARSGLHADPHRRRRAHHPLRRRRARRRGSRSRTPATPSPPMWRRTRRRRTTTSRSPSGSPPPTRSTIPKGCSDAPGARAVSLDFGFRPLAVTRPNAAFDGPCSCFHAARAQPCIRQVRRWSRRPSRPRILPGFPQTLVPAARRIARQPLCPHNKSCAAFLRTCYFFAKGLTESVSRSKLFMVRGYRTLTIVFGTKLAMANFGGETMMPLGNGKRGATQTSSGRSPGATRCGSIWRSWASWVGEAVTVVNALGGSMILSVKGSRDRAGQGDGDADHGLIRAALPAWSAADRQKGAAR